MWSSPTLAARLAKPAVTEPSVPAEEESANRFSPLVWSAVLGALALWSVTLGASMNVSPFVLHEPGSWLFSTGPGSNHGMLASLVLVYGGLLLFLRVWLDLVRWLEANPGLPVVKLVPVFALWVVPMMVVPPLFSKDVYSYAAQGEMVSHHISPYVYGPSVLGDGSPFLFARNGGPLADPLWANARTPYGPLVLWIDGLVVRMDGHSPLATVVVMRALAFVGVALIAIFIPRLARLYLRDGAVGFAAAVLNPVTLFHLVGGAHNDALMAGLLVAGIALAREGRPIVGIVLCTLAAAVKAPAELAVVYIGWEWLGVHLSFRERVRPVMTALTISGIVMAAISFMSGLGWGWLGAMGTPGTVVSMVTPTTLAGTLMTHTSHLVGIGVSSASMLSVSRVAGLVVAGAGCLALLALSDRMGAVRALALSLLLLVILGPVVQPWYLAWGLVMAAPVVTGKLRRTVFVLSAVVCFLGLPGAGKLFFFLTHNVASVAVGVGILVLVLITPLKGWVRRVVRLRPRGYTASPCLEGVPPGS